MNFIPYGHQDISRQDIDSVVEVLRSDWLTQGPSIERFEKEVASKVGAKYAVAVSNATTALHIACLAAGLKEGGRLWTSPITFVASANCGLYCGAEVDFVDIDPATLNMSVSVLEEKLRVAERAGKLPDVVIPVHFGGQSCEMEKMRALSMKYGFKLIEDASHAIGGRYQDTMVGSCRFSDMAIFSFHPVKIITTGEGGMILTNREDLYRLLMRLRTHGITRDPSLMSALGRSEGSWYYEQIELGFNYRITDFQAALGFSQLKRLDEFVKKRHELVGIYDRELANLPLKTQKQLPETYSGFHLYVIRVDAKKRRQIFDALKEAKIGVNVHYIPVHLQPWYKRFGFKAGDFPEAEKYYSEAITLPLFPTMSGEDQKRVISELRQALG